MRADLRLAIRMLRRTPGFAITVILTLAVGIAATTAVYSVVDVVLVKPLPFDHPERVVRVEVRRKDGQFGVAGGVLDALGRLPVVERAAVFIGSDRTLRDGADLEQLRGALVSAEFFAAFGVSPLMGRTFADAAAADVAPLVLGERAWRRRFADRSVIGRIVRLEDRPHAVVGVMPERFAVPADAEFWAPLAIDARQRAEIGPGPFDGVVRLRNGNVDAASAQADALSASLADMSRQQQQFVFIPLLEVMGRPYRGMLMLLMAASGMVLLIACGNAANLCLAQMRRRTREVAVRSAIGATRGRIVCQLATEALAIGAIAAMLACSSRGSCCEWAARLACPSFPRWQRSV